MLRVRLANISHHVIDLYMSGNNLMAEIEIINTTPGQQLRSLLSAGVPIGFRMSLEAVSRLGIILL